MILKTKFWRVLLPSVVEVSVHNHMRIHVLDSGAQAAALTSQTFKTAESAQRKKSHVHVHVFI